MKEKISKIFCRVDAIGYNLWELAQAIEKTDEKLVDELYIAINYLSEFADNLYKKKEQKFDDGIKDWLENHEEWDQAAMNFEELTNQPKE